MFSPVADAGALCDTCGEECHVKLLWWKFLGGKRKKNVRQFFQCEQNTGVQVQSSCIM